MSKAKIPKVTVPRSMDEIRTEYNALRSLVADSQYQVYVHRKALKGFNTKMEDLNREGGARIELDRASAEAKSTETEVTPDAK